MPKYNIISGELDVFLIRDNAKKAAQDAINALNTSPKSFKLGLLTQVVSDDETKYISTAQLLKQSSLNYKLDGKNEYKIGTSK